MSVVLVIEDEPVLARNLRDALQFHGYDVTLASSGEQGIEIAESLRPNLVISDYRLPGIDGLEVIHRIRRTKAPTACIIITAHGDVAMAVAAMKAGASDFLAKPLNLFELCETAARVLRQQLESVELNLFRERERAVSAVDAIVGNAPRIRDVRELIRRIGSVPTMVSREPPCVLINGETGTGKDLVARAIHHAGPRRGAPFVHVNCTAIPEQLAESELFGHVKGAFTDARGDKRGLFELADGGTLFLDEIGHMSPALQAKLLTTIDQRMIRPVGAAQERKINVHMIAATNRRLDEAVEDGEFRGDLLHRLRLITIALPPLRERGPDVELLARHFLRVHAARAGAVVEDFGRDALEAVTTYDWPGNVRELSHTVERAVLFADGPLIRSVHLNLQEPARKEHVSVEIPNETTIRLDFERNCPTLEEIEYRIMVAALQHSSHNLSRAARLLGISRDAIRYRMDRFRRREEPGR